MATLKLENFGPGTTGSTSPSLFASKLQNAVSTAVPGTVIDCTSYTGTITLASAITITRSVSLVFGNLTLVQGKVDQNLFNIFAPNVSITGVSRSTNSTANDGKTVFSINISSVASYHIFCANTSASSPSWASYSGLTLQNFDCIGLQSSYTASSGNPVYTVNGAGGILIAEGNPGQANTNVQNVLISNVMVNNVGKHGIMIYGGMTSKLEKCRVSGAGGHGFYITGGSTSVNLDTCYASGTKLAGFCLHDTTYSTLNNCASDSNGLGYWMRNANSITMSSCGAEANQVRTSIPNNLGITLPSQSGTITINDIGSDNVNFIKGTSYLFTGGSNITGTACYSKDPGNGAGQTTFTSKYTAHIHGAYGTDKVNMDNFKRAGTSVTKYLYRLEDVINFHIDDAVSNYDPTNPTESPDGSMTFVNQILDQGGNNVFGDFASTTSWGGRRVDIRSSEENLRVNQLYVPGRLTIPVEPGHPVNPEAGTIYFNNTLKKLYMFDGNTWFDTCCATAPTPAPECVFPNGGVTTLTDQEVFRASYFYAIGTKTYFVSTAQGYNLTNNPEAAVFMVFDSTTEVLTPLITRNDLFGLETSIAYAPSTVAYSSLTNSFYIGFSWGFSPSNPGGILSDSYNKLIKYNLNTSTIDATVDEYIGIDPAESTPEKVLGTDQIRYVVQGSTLKQINFGRYGENLLSSKPVVIINRNAITLDFISQVTGDIIAPNSVGQSGPFINNGMINNPILITDDRILTNVYLQEGDTALKFGVLDLSDGLMSYVTYDTLASPFSGSVNYVRQTFSKSQTNSSTFFLTDAIAGKIYEIDLNTLDIEDEWLLGTPAYSIYDYMINSVRFLIFTGATYNSQSNLYEWKLVTFNTSNAELTYSTYIIAYTATITAFYFTPTLGSGMVFDIENNNMYTASSFKIQKFCAPYAV